MLRKNIIANVMGGAWIAVLTLVVTPIQVHLLGVEAFGIVGLIAILQIVLGTLDLGLSATITQSLAADRSDGLSLSRPLIASAFWFYHGLAVLIGVGAWFAAPLIAHAWLNSRSISPSVLEVSVRIICVYLAIRWPVAFFTGVINGLQRMDLLNALKAAAGTFRLVGGVIAILINPTIIIFLTWFLLSAIIELIMFAAVASWLLPRGTLRAKPKLKPFREIWRFSLTITAVSLLATLLTQVDRLMVSKLLGLQQLGLYTLAYTAGMALSLVQVSLNNAALPAYAHSYASDVPGALIARYYRTSELMGYLLALPCAILGLFGRDILILWVGQAAGDGAYMPLRYLAAGFFFNAMVSNAYIVAVATRQVAIPALVNVVGALLYVPLLFWLIDTNGITGAGQGWALLNGFYIPTLLLIVHRRILKVSIGIWLLRNALAPAGLAVGTLLSARVLAQNSEYPLAIWGALACACLLYAGIGLAFVSSALRGDVFAFVGQLVGRRATGLHRG